MNVQQPCPVCFTRVISRIYRTSRTSSRSYDTSSTRSHLRSSAIAPFLLNGTFRQDGGPRLSKHPRHERHLRAGKAAKALRTTDPDVHWPQNKTLSDDSSKILKMQGIGWLVRQAVAYSNITVTLKQYTDDAGKVNIDIDQVSSGGLRSKEERVLDWEWREKEDGIFGKLKGQTRSASL